MEKIKIKVHKKEKMYYNIMIGVSILFSIIGLILLPYFLFIGLFLLFSTGVFIGYLKGSGVRVNKGQFPDLYAIVVEQCKKLDIKNVPEIYIVESGGILNAMATKFIGANYLIIYSDLYEVIMDGRRDIVEFIIGHELCHVKRNHVYKKLYVLPSLIIPFLPQAYSRACEYTCDNVGYTLSPKGAIDGIKLLASGKRLYRKMDSKLFANQLTMSNGFWVWFSEKLSTHPHLSKRITSEMLQTNSNSFKYSDNKMEISTITNSSISDVKAQHLSEIEEIDINDKNKGDDNERFMPKF